MAQSTGTKKLKCAVFISGTGSNLKSLIQFAKKKNSPISIELICLLYTSDAADE